MFETQKNIFVFQHQCIKMFQSENEKNTVSAERNQIFSSKEEIIALRNPWVSEVMRFVTKVEGIFLRTQCGGQRT